MRLGRDFFFNSTLCVAKDLLGKVLVYKSYKGIITETEAYVGQEDPACHAAKGKTLRNAIMFGPPGHSYVYMIYGMYFCLNIVTEQENFPAAVLIRGMHVFTPENKRLNGPGKLCRYLGITKVHNGVDLVTSQEFYVKDANYKPSYVATPRVGIKVAQDRLWRFLVQY